MSANVVLTCTLLRNIREEKKNLKKKEKRVRQRGNKKECSYYPVMAKRWAFLPTIH
jgi:hypothetical protein